MFILVGTRCWLSAPPISFPPTSVAAPCRPARAVHCPQIGDDTCLVLHYVDGGTVEVGYQHLGISAVDRVQRRRGQPSPGPDRFWVGVGVEAGDGTGPVVGPGVGIGFPGPDGCSTRCRWSLPSAGDRLNPRTASSHFTPSGPSGTHIV